MAGTGSLIHDGGKMSHFLWVEDFAGTTLRDTTVNVFGELLQNQKIPDTKKEVKKLLREQGVFVELSFLGGLDFIRDPQKLFQVDYIILDIWLDVKIKSDKDENNWLPQILQEYYGYEPQPNDEAASEKSLTEAKKKLLNLAGYQLYVELVMEHGFPKDHILFCSDHADQQKSIQAHFKQAKVELPLLLSKDDKTQVQTWVRKRRENHYSHYSVLRRGIINGCQHIQSLLENQKEAAIQFDEFVETNNNSQQQTISVQDMLDYLETLQNILPLRQPNNPQRLYKLFIRSLAHEWDNAYHPNNLPKCDQDDKDCFQARRIKSTFGWIMKHARNWAAHTTVFDQLAAQEVAFLFMVAMRAMFKLTSTTEKYESMLFNLFSAEKTESIDGDKVRIFLAETYSDLKNKIVDNKSVKDAFYFSEMLNNLQNGTVPHNYKKGLFQMFWHGLSPVRLHKKRNKDGTLGDASFVPSGTNMVRTNYIFPHHDYGKAENGFLFELARSIYKRSFS
jgi:hypothetical protein